MIEILYFDGCPNHHGLEEHIRALCTRLGLDMPVVSRRIDTDEQASDEHFLGSPTVRVNGVDVDSTATDRRSYGLTCRVYPAGGRIQGTPPDAWIIGALDRRRPQTKTPSGPRD